MTSSASPAPAIESPAFTILCVDDEPNILSALRRLFRPQGYTVKVAGSGAEGLAVIDAEQVDLIISDMRMPGMDGAAFLAEACKRQPDAVRLLLTGYADMDSTVAAIARLVEAGGWPDAVLRVFAILGYATPVFFIGLMLKLIFSVHIMYTGFGNSGETVPILKRHSPHRLT